MMLLPLSIQDIGRTVYEFIDKFLIQQNRWRMITDGLWNTLILAFFSAIMGIILGTVVAIVRNVGSWDAPWILRLLKKLCDGYVTVVRGTPVMVQLLIWSTVILLWKETLPIAIIGFGFNSGAYVAEIVRAGIDAVDIGQTEAGRSLGLSRFATMRHIVLPQAIKNVLPALGNEFIILLKETSIAVYVGVSDLTQAGAFIKTVTYDGKVYFIVAGIYLLLVMGLSRILRIFERRLAKSDRG